jgi:hypothetical protein
MDFLAIGCKDVDWNHVAKDIVQWWTFVNTVMNIHFAKYQGPTNQVTTTELVGLCHVN